MQALQHALDGEMDKAREVLAQIPTRNLEEELARLRTGVETLSELSRDLPGNREQRRAAARASE